MTVIVFSSTARYLFAHRLRRQAIALLLILGLHVFGLYFIFRSETFPLLRQKATAMFLQLLPARVELAQREPNIVAPKSNIKPITRPRIESTKRPLALEDSRPHQTSEVNDPTLDPFGTLEAKPNSAPTRLPDSDHYRQDASKAWKQVEAELPIKRVLNAKKELSTMERFAQNLLEGAPAKEIQTKEEMRPDGSRMTRVKTPRGEFCVTAPQPGRTYDARGPELRVMSCPIYF